MFIPFISDVRVRSDGGASNGGPQSFEGDDSLRHLTSNVVTSSPSVNSSNVNTAASGLSSGGESRDHKFQDIPDKSRERVTPPSSPHIGSGSHFFAGSIGGSAGSPPVSLSKDRCVLCSNMT